MIDGERVVHELVLAAPREAVFDHFVDPARLVRWLGVAADLDARPGGRFRFEVEPGQFCEGAYLTLERPALVVFTWGWSEPSMGLPPGSSQVTVELAEVDGGTRLRLTHDRLPGDLRLLHDDGWSRFLPRLTAVLRGDPPGGHPDGDPATRLAQLREEGAAS
jgi:uncharacterized protein YndB with AHSA1/START domain